LEKALETVMKGGERRIPEGEIDTPPERIKL